MVLYNFGNLLTKIADALMSCIPKNETKKCISKNVLDLFGSDEYNEIKYSSNIETKMLEKLIDEINDHINEQNNYFTIDFVLLVNRLSGLFYRRSSRFYSYAFQYKKLLYILKDSVCLFVEKQDFLEQNNVPPKINQDLVTKTAENVAVRIFQINTWIQNIANRLQILKYREIFDGGDALEDEETKAIYLNLTTSPEVRETIAIVEEMKLGLKRQTDDKSGFNDIVTPNDSISSRFTRVIELRLQSKINMYRLECLFVADDLRRWKRTYKKLGEEENKLEEQNLEKIREKIKEHQEVIHDCICDSIFALFEVTKTLHVYGESYVVNHSYIASNHRKLGDWCLMYENYKIIIEESNTLTELQKSEMKQINETLEHLLGKHDMVYIASYYQYAQAINYLYAAIQTHNGGKAYRTLNKNMSFSEDDFNDNLTNFSAASERLRINSGIIHALIDKLKLKLESSEIYKYERYRNDLVTKNSPS